MTKAQAVGSLIIIREDNTEMIFLASSNQRLEQTAWNAEITESTYESAQGFPQPAIWSPRPRRLLCSITLDMPDSTENLGAASYHGLLSTRSTILDVIWSIITDEPLERAAWGEGEFPDVGGPRNNAYVSGR
jgi:hypothetical protein